MTSHIDLLIMGVTSEEGGLETMMECLELGAPDTPQLKPQ